MLSMTRIDGLCQTALFKRYSKNAFKRGILFSTCSAKSTWMISGVFELRNRDLKLRGYPYESQTVRIP